MEFGSRIVTWAGMLTEKPHKNKPPVVTLTVPKSEIKLEESVSVHLDKVYVGSAKDAVSRWGSMSVGTRLSFSAILIAPVPSGQSTDAQRWSKGHIHRTQ